MVRARSRAWIPVLAMVLCGLMALTVGLGGGAAMAQGASASVSIQNFAFSPGTIQIAAGTTVTWTNNDQTAHTVTADDGSFDSGAIAPGGTFSMTFNNPATIAYHCKIHPNMTASIVVMAAAQQGNQAKATTAPATTATTQAPAVGSTATTASLPVTGSGSAAAPLAHSHVLTALVLALLSIGLGLLASFRGVRRR